MALTAQQLSDLRADLGDSNTAFGDAELQRNWDRLTNAADDQQRHNATLALSWRQLLASASKLHDYTAGATGEKLKQVRDNIKDMYDLYADDLDAALGSGAGILKSGVGSFAHPTRTLPAEEIARERKIEQQSSE